MLSCMRRTEHGLRFILWSAGNYGAVLNVTPRGRVYHFRGGISCKCEMIRVRLILVTLLFYCSVQAKAEKPECHTKTIPKSETKSAGQNSILVHK